MKLEGHRVITKKAVQEFLKEYTQGSEAEHSKQLYQRTSTRYGEVVKGPSNYAVSRDIKDVLTLGHWSNFAQKHHFMRQFDGQSPYEAYEAGCTWIMSNSQEWANKAAAGQGANHLQKLGNACHALEDSFACGHAVREKPKNDKAPGAIMHVKMYAGEEKENHSHYDKTWQRIDGDLSFEGRLAKNAVKGLLYMIFDSIYAANGTTVNIQSKWSEFKNHWLRASPSLSKQRDEAYDLIDQYYSGIVWGNTQTATNFDEKGLAKAIYNKHGSNTQKIYNVFHRLNEFHTVDADDVALIYLELVRKNAASSIGRAIGTDAKVRNLLIKILDEGWTSSEEQKCIDFLKGFA